MIVSAPSPPVIVCAALVPVTTSILAKLSSPTMSPATALMVTVSVEAPPVMDISVPALLLELIVTSLSTVLSARLTVIAPEFAFVVTRLPMKFVMLMAPAAAPVSPFSVRLTSLARAVASIVTVSLAAPALVRTSVAPAPVTIVIVLSSVLSAVVTVKAPARFV